MDHSTSLLHLLHRASQIAEERLTRGLGDTDVTPRQIAVLVVIADREDLKQTDVTEATGIDRSTLADIVRRLVDRKLVSRKRTKDDARAYALKVTDAGRRVLTTSMPVLARVEAELLDVLPAKKRGELVGLLKELTEKGARVDV